MRKQRVAMKKDLQRKLNHWDKDTDKSRYIPTISKSRGTYSIYFWFKNIFFFLNFLYDTKMEYTETIFRYHWSFVFDPAGRLCYYWSLVVSIAFLYNFWVIIFRFSFAEIDENSILYWFCLDYFMDLIYILDVLFHFRTGYLEV